MTQPQPLQNVFFVHGNETVPAIVLDPAFKVSGAEDEIAQKLLVVAPGSPFTIVANYSPDKRPATWHYPDAVPCCGACSCR